ncbi:MAG: membrane dipeptidase [Promethearchaeota archaeon]|nr:MAG: membrane dipeptidase [Candidatus Lokiarchaeota archaeon]
MVLRNPPVIDGHIDTALEILRQPRKFSERSTIGHCDFHRMKEANVIAALFAIESGYTMESLIKSIDIWFKFTSNPDNGLMHIKTVEDFDKLKDSGHVGALLHFEGVSGMDDEFKLLRLGYHLGLRSMGLTWSNVNKFATGVRVTTNRQRKTGLTDMGRDLVREAQNLGITIDVSHLNDQSFWDLYEITEKPIIATHSNARSICNHPRNLTDDQIKAIHEKHGTIGINFGMKFLDPDHPGEEFTNLSLDVVKQHIDHIVKLADINTIAIGSDYDGTTIPNCLSDCTKLPFLWEYLLENGYSEQDIKKISHQNLLRVFKDTW